MLWLEKEREYSEVELDVIKLVEEKYKTDRFISSLIAERNNFDVNEIDYFLSDVFKPISPFGLKDMDKAVNIIFEHMKCNNKILAVTDYDLDGTFSSVILYHLMKAFNYKNFDYYMPHRQRESYGLSVMIVEEAFKKGVSLIITADNGISAFDAINRANELGIDVVVTDHHEIQTKKDERGNIVYNLPAAKAIVNPHQQDCSYPYKMLSGGGVSYKLCQALIMKAPKDIRQRFLTEGYKEKVISAAAISAIGDVMLILGENRALVKEALKYLENGCIPAVKSILDKPSVSGVSFNLGPHLSSVGRLSDMNKSLRFLLEENEDKINEMLPEIRSYNDARKSEQEKGIEKALDIISKYDALPDIIIEVLDDVRPTILGLVAGKIKERFNRPTILFSKTPSGDFKGSGRSIDSYNMYGSIEVFLGEDGIEGLSGGGHFGACGLKAETLDAISELKSSLLSSCKLTEFDKTPKVYIDKYLSIRDDFKKLHDDLSLLEPFGLGNPSPVFAIKSVYLDFEFKKYKYGEFAIITVSDNLCDDFSVDAVCWNEDEFLRDGKKVFDVVEADIIVSIEMDSYKNKPRLNIKSIRFK